MILDCFMFCHELDFLEKRLRILFPVVDCFVIQEANITHSGLPKPYYLEENFNRFHWAAPKIKHIKFHQEARKPINDFEFEKKQRRSLYEAAKKSANPDDIILLSDVDEIPSREIVGELREGKIPLPATFEQDLYYYDIHTPLGKHWLGTTAIRASDSIHEDLLMRTNRIRTTERHGGWHFSYFLSNEDIITKLKSFAHANTYGNPPYTNLERLNKHRADKTSFLEKSSGKETFKPLPDYVLEVFS